MRNRAAALVGMWLIALAPALAAEPTAEQKKVTEAFEKAKELEKQGKQTEAVKQYEAVLEKAAAVYGKDSTAVAFYSNHLGLRYTWAGQYAKAEPLYLNSRRLFEDKRGKDHPQVAVVLNNLTMLYREQGHYARAKEVGQAALRIREALGKDSVETAQSLNELALVFAESGQYAEAEALYQRSLKIREAKLGKDHRDVAESLNNLATLYRDQGRYSEAQQLYQQSLDLFTASKDDLRIATVLNQFAVLYQEQRLYTQAEKLYDRCLKLREAKFGPEHPLCIESSNNLATLYQRQGEFTKAERRFQTCLKLAEATLGKDHPRVAVALRNLAKLYHERKQYDEAAPLYERSLSICEGKLGKTHSEVGSVLNSLGRLFFEKGDYDKALPLYRRSLEIKEAALGKDHIEVADIRHGLARLYYKQKQYAAAEEEFQRCVKLREDRLGKDNPAVAEVLNNLAVLHQVQGQTAKTEPLLQRCVRIYETSYGKDHPNAIIAAMNLARLTAEVGRFAEALPLFDRARHGVRQHVLGVLPGLPDTAAQANFLHDDREKDFPRVLSFGLAQPQDRRVVAQAAAWLLNGKAVTHEALAQSTLLSLDGADAATKKMSQELLDLRRELSRLSLIAPSAGGEAEHRKQVDRLAAQEQELARTLRQTGLAKARPLPWVELDELRKRLPAGTAFIDVARFRVFPFQAKASERKWQAEHYVAWITMSAGDVHMIDLGPADAVDASVVAVRKALKACQSPKASENPILKRGEIEAEQEMRRTQAALAQLVLHPLLPHLGKADRLILSPDGNLWLVPWNSLPLPDDRYAIEKYAISYATSGRDLLQTAIAVKTGPAAILADPNYDLESKAGQPAPVRDASRDKSPGAATRGSAVSRALAQPWPRLDGTAEEARSIKPALDRYVGTGSRLYLGDEALEATCKAVSHPRVLVLSTHGFFYPESRTGGGPGDPLLSCGLLFAGCNNHARLKSGEEDGVLFGREILGMDLRGTELVVLSACETGLGEVRYGEGVAGLRQAFQLAGAGAVVSTLWQVPDEESAQLMTLFFERLASGQSKSDALRQAQLRMIETRRKSKKKAAHPYYWAAYTLTEAGK